MGDATHEILSVEILSAADPPTLARSLRGETQSLLNESVGHSQSVGAGECSFVDLACNDSMWRTCRCGHSL